MAKKPITPRKAPPPRPRTLWPLFLGAAALILVVAGVLALSRPASQTAAPAATTPAGPATAQLTVDQAAIDFGDVPVEKAVTATFVLKNTGGEDLRILNQPQVRVVEGC